MLKTESAMSFKLPPAIGSSVICLCECHKNQVATVKAYSSDMSLISLSLPHDDIALPYPSHVKRAAEGVES